MRRLALVALLLAATSDARRGDGRFDRVNSRCAQGRSDRGLPCGDNFAFFEFAPANGAGMGAACACAAITGAKGEAVTFSRAGAATCSPLGLATTGITTASLVECGANLPRVEASGGVNGLRVGSQRSNALLRFIDLANATWADVGTPALTGAQPSPFTGTYANLGVQVDDNDAAAQEGRAQTVTVTAAVAHTMHCYVRAGTLASATVSLDGTTASITGLSTTTWSIVEVTDASSSGVAISAQVLAGAAASDVGTVVWGGCQVEQGLYRTSIIPTVATSVTRNAESPFGALPASQVGSMAVTVQVPYPSSAAVGVNRRLLRTDVSGSDVDRFELFWSASANVQTFVSVGGVAGASPFSALQTVPGTHRAVAWRTPGVTTANITNGVQVTAADSQAAFPAFNRVYLGVYAPSAGFELDGIITRVCVDPDPTRCR